MNPKTLPVKRRPVNQGILKRLSAVTNQRKQRVAAAVPGDMEMDDGSSKISRALTIVFLIHIVAIALIFVHQKFLEDRAPVDSKSGTVAGLRGSKAVSASAVEAAVSPPPRRLDLPRIATGEKPYLVSRNDNYANIAADLGVHESDLRLINQHEDIKTGKLLRVPPKRIVALDPPEVTAILNQAKPVDDSGLVDAVPVDVSNAPRAQAVRPAAVASTSATVEASGKKYVVQNGDSIWKIANRFKVNQSALMKANDITDPRKMKVGMSLSIPK